MNVIFPWRENVLYSSQYDTKEHHIHNAQCDAQYTIHNKQQYTTVHTENNDNSTVYTVSMSNKK